MKKSIKRGGLHPMPVKLKEPNTYVETIRIYKRPSYKEVYSGIDPYNPPYKITYDVLEKIYSSDILNKEIEKLTDKAEEIAMEIAKNSEEHNIEQIFHKTIKKKYKECKKIARRRLWTYFYTTMFGTVYKTIKPITIAQAIKEADAFENTIESLRVKLNESRESSSSKMDKSIESLRVKLNESRESSSSKMDKSRESSMTKMYGANGDNFFNTEVLVRYLTFNIYPLAFSVWKALRDNTQNKKAIRYQPQDHYDRMGKIRQNIMDGLRNNGSDIKMMKDIQRELLSVAKDKVMLSFKIRDEIEKYKDNLDELYVKNPPRKENRRGEFTIYMPFPSKNVLLYGMPLPYQFDRKILFRNMLYYVE